MIKVAFPNRVSACSMAGNVVSLIKLRKIENLNLRKVYVIIQYGKMEE